MTETINEGTYGVVFAVRDVETGVHGVIKVAKAVGNDAGNQTAEWESFVLEKMYKKVRISSSSQSVAEYFALAYVAFVTSSRVLGSRAVDRPLGIPKLQIFHTVYQ